MTPVIIDAIAVAVLAVFAWLGARKGLLRTLAGLLVIIFSLVGAGIIASALTEPVAKLIAPVIEKRVESHLEEAILERNRTTGEKPPFDLTELLEMLGVDKARWKAMTRRAEKTVQDTGASLASAVIESVARAGLYGVLYMISFVLLLIGLNLLVQIFDLWLRLPGLHWVNVCGGGLAGVAEGALILFLAVWVLRLLGVSFDWKDGGPIYRFFTTYTPLDALKFLGV